MAVDAAYKPWKKTGKGMVGFEHAKLSVHQLWATVDIAGQVTVEDDNPVRLPCLIDEKGCALEGTAPPTCGTSPPNRKAARSSSPGM